MSETIQPDYDDSYPTCAETYSTLCIFSDELTPEEISSTLGINPTKHFQKGDVYSKRKLHRKSNGWFYSTEGLCSSKDTRRHIDMILAALRGKEDSVEKIRRLGCKIDITSYWVSASGHGGPWLMPQQMIQLGTLGIEIWWDVYFNNTNEAK